MTYASEELLAFKANIMYGFALTDLSYGLVQMFVAPALCSCCVYPWW